MADRRCTDAAVIALYDDLSRTGTALDMVLPTTLMGLKSSADLLVESMQMRNRYVAALQQKLANAAPGDKADIESGIQTLETGKYASESDLIRGEAAATQAYAALHATLAYFQTACADAARAHTPTPWQCGKMADYVPAYQTSLADTRAKFAIAEQMLEAGQ